MTSIPIVFLLVTYLLAGDLDPSGGFSSMHIVEVPLPAGSTIADCEANKAPVLLDALMSGEVDASAVFFAAKCEEMILQSTSGV